MDDTLTITERLARRAAERVVLLPFEFRSKLPVGCVEMAKELGLCAGDRVVSKTIDRAKPYGADHSHTDKLYLGSTERFVEVEYVVRFVGRRWLVCDRYWRTSYGGQAWSGWEDRELAEISAGCWHWLREFAPDWEVIRR